jgi:hypothetical protein
VERVLLSLMVLTIWVTQCGEGVTVTYGFDNLGDAMWKGRYCYLLLYQPRVALCGRALLSLMVLTI